MSDRPKGPPPSSAGFNPDTAESSLSPGEDFGQYRIIKLLGVGGMGEVYEVRHRVLDTRHAIKLINETIMRNSMALSYFKTEGRVMAQLHHPGIVLVDEFGETDGRYWLRMELMSGVECTGGDLITLEDYVWYMGGKLTEDEVRECMRQFLDAIGFAHNRGIVHRDLKPTNILLHPTGMKIADFGLVKMAGNSWHQDRILSSISSDIELDEAAKAIKGRSGPRTAEKAIVGTYEYMAPEQKRGEEVDARSDLYAVGLVCFQVLTGEETPGFKKPSELIPGINPDWDVWLEKALSKAPDGRFQSAEEMKHALPTQVSTTTSESKPKAKVAPPPPRKKSWLPLSIAGGASLLALIIIALVITSKNRQQEQAQEPDADPANAEPATDPAPIPPPSPEPTTDTPPEPVNADALFLAQQELLDQFNLAREKLATDIQDIEQEYKTQPPNDLAIQPSIFNAPPLPHPIADAGHRTWADPTGATFVATLVRINESDLLLKDKNGVEVPHDKDALRSEDLAYLENWTSTYLPEMESPFVVHSASMFMRWIQRGSVQLGSDNPGQEFPEESPATEARLSKGFWIGQYEVTQAQFRRLTGNNPSHFTDNPDYPAESISWARATQFCEELTKLEKDADRLPPGWYYRLPSEAQWQLAYGEDTTPLAQSSWHAHNSAGSVRRVGLLEPNSNGLYDMKGNVKEWVRDVFGAYPGGLQRDWVNESGGLNHILRGGSWKSPTNHCRINARFRPRTGYTGPDAGFRIALVFGNASTQESF